MKDGNKDYHSMLSSYYKEENDEKKECVLVNHHSKNDNKHFFQNAICVTACKIVGRSNDDIQ